MIELLGFLFTHPGIVFSFKYNSEDDVFEIGCTTDEANIESYHIYEMKNVPDLVNHFARSAKPADINHSAFIFVYQSFLSKILYSQMSVFLIIKGLL